MSTDKHTAEAEKAHNDAARAEANANAEADLASARESGQPEAHDDQKKMD